MKEGVRSQAFLRKRKMMLALPLLVLPFLTIGFYALGGGVVSPAGVAKKEEGLNMNLPSAALKAEKNPDKMSFYERADKEEQDRQSTRKYDPYYDLPEADSSDELNTSPVYQPGRHDPVEEQVNRKLQRLQEEMDRPAVAPPVRYQSPALPTDVKRLEEMMAAMQEKRGDDPEMQQLEGMLDKIMDIQHPGRVRAELPVAADHFFAVRLSGDDTVAAEGFYGMPLMADAANESNAIEAVIQETLTLVNGSVVRLRLLQDVYVNGKRVPKDGFVYGIASLQGERLRVAINSIRCGNSLFPVKLQVYDLDGLEGVYVPGAISREVAKQSADNSLQLMDAGMMDPSLKAQATAAGIGAAKNFLSRKVKLVRVTVLAGYKVLLYDQGNDLFNKK